MIGVVGLLKWGAVLSDFAAAVAVNVPLNITPRAWAIKVRLVKAFGG